ncbi:MAG TPA: hypothetical protein VFQ96_02235 [Microbacteriaceae bacterium]|nr:hypothetical protein [Microbacteriaceae bacterium]
MTDREPVGGADAQQPGRHAPVIVVGLVPHQPERVALEAARFAGLLGAELVCAHVDPERYVVQR